MGAVNYSAAFKRGIVGLIFVPILTAAFSCKKTLISDAKPQVDYSTAQITADRTGPVDIYLAGWRAAYPDFEFATSGKNGVISDLTNGANYIQANSVAVSGTDVYIGGNQNGMNHVIGLYWKNGDLHYITDTTKNSHISSAAASGNDIYFAGYESNGTHNIATYWKNGQSVKLTSGTTDAQVNSIAVWGGNVYAAGWEKNNAVEVAKYWKNGVAVNLGDGKNNSEANSIAVWGDDVFVVGVEYVPLANGCAQCETAIADNAVFKVWKNGGLLATAGNSQVFTAVAASNSGVYIAGNDSGRLCYFKNGTPVYITQGGTEVLASAIELWGNDVYLAGYENINGHNVAAYWKNGAPTYLPTSNNNSYLTGLFLAKQ